MTDTGTTTETNIRNISNICIPELCTGDIDLIASVQEIREGITDPNAKRDSVECSRSLPDITLVGDGHYEMVINTANTDNILREVPAFYDSGTITVNALVARSDDPDGAIDLHFDLILEVEDSNKPGWYPYSLAHIVDPDDSDKIACCSALDGTVTSPKEDVEHASIGRNTNLPVTFTLNEWKGFKPIVNRVTSKGVITGCLPPLTFRLRIYNNLAYDVIFSSISVSISIGYQTNCTLGNLGSKYSSDYCLMYCDPLKLPGDDENNEDEGLDRYIWAIVDGYEGGTGTELQEIVKVFGYYLHTEADNKSKTLKTIVLEPVENTGGANYPPVVYKSKTALLKRIDNTRMIYRGPSSGEQAWVVTQEIICKDGRFFDTVVESKKLLDPEVADSPYIPCNPGDEDAVFFIRTEIADDIDETTIEDGITVEDINDSIKTLKFFNVDTTYLGCIDPGDDEMSEDDVDGMTHQIARTSINKLFYDTLTLSYEQSVVFMSFRDDVEPYILVKINSNQFKDPLDWIPIYNGKPIKFSESLRYCIDGVRSRDIWFFGDKKDKKCIPNTIEVKCDVPRIYRINIEISYEKYLNSYLHKYEDEDEEEEEQP